MLIHENYFENPQVLHVNTCPNRAYCVPAPTEPQAVASYKMLSDAVTPLNGDWDFHFTQTVREFDEEFYKLNYDTSSWDSISVPSVWQMNGYDNCQYTNISYPFPCTPPYLPEEIPAGAYRRSFHFCAPKGTKKHYLNFDGVDSAFYVWLNGEFVGYSQVPHSISEFDVTDLLQNGENVIAVLVLKWCEGSYFEDQDKFRFSGIFRDVYLLSRPENHLRDYTITTKINSENSATVNVKLSFLTDVDTVEFKLLDGKFNCCTKGKTDSENFSIEISDPILWTAENPYLYTLVMETNGEFIAQRVGVREVSIKDGVLMLNNAPIRFRGVNRHDANPITGSTVSVDDMEEDLRLMKLNNINAIRTSHYPNAPEFLKLCDSYGFYLIDEADVETHGSYPIEHQGRGFGDNPDYEETILDRVQRCVIRDKNHPCVLIWSMGNESYYGKNFETALAWTKQYDDTRPTHYERSCVCEDAEHTKDIDIFSRMYVPVDYIDDYFKKENQKPFVLCEYIHAMGNSQGDAEDYFQCMERHDGFCGGFVWEWCDHAVFTGKAENGVDKYLYGGDFGEFPHDDNFCVDGMVTPDRLPHVGLLEFKNVCRPVRISKNADAADEFTIKNMLDFTEIAGNIKVTYTVMCDGEPAQQGEISDDLLHIKPRESKTVTLPLSQKIKQYDGKCAVLFHYYSMHKTAFVPENHELGYEQISLNESANKHLAQLKAATLNTCAITVKETYRMAEISGKDFMIKYSKSDAAPCYVKILDKVVLSAPIKYNVWRAPIDNEREKRVKWQEAGYDRLTTRALDTKLTQTEESVRIENKVILAPVYGAQILGLSVCWTIGNDGTIGVKISADKNEKSPDLPRFGLRLELPKEWDDVEYFGYGPYESYIDKHSASYESMFKSNVSGLYEDYIKPQENGSHFGVSYVKIQNKPFSLLVTSDDKFSFNYSQYTQEELTSKKHNFELVPADVNTLCIDYKQTGIGSASCGPDLEERYRFNELNFTCQYEFRWIL